MNRFFQFLQRIFQRPAHRQNEPPPSPSSGSATDPNLALVQDNEALISLMHLLEETKEGKYTCQETLDLLDEYVELAAENQDVAAIMPMVKSHIGDCPDCNERYEALLHILQNS